MKPENIVFFNNDCSIIWFTEQMLITKAQVKRVKCAILCLRLRSFNLKWYT